MLEQNASRQKEGPERINEMIKRENVIFHSSIENFNLFMLEEMIRVSERLQLSCLPFETKHPVILSNKQFVTDLIIIHHHLLNVHVRVTLNLSGPREKYWIARGYSTVRKVLKHRYLCRGLSSTPCSQIMVPTPEC